MQFTTIEQWDPQGALTWIRTALELPKDWTPRIPVRPPPPTPLGWWRRMQERLLWGRFVSKPESPPGPLLPEWLYLNRSTLLVVLAGLGLVEETVEGMADRDADGFIVRPKTVPTRFLPPSPGASLARILHEVAACSGSRPAGALLSWQESPHAPS